MQAEDSQRKPVAIGVAPNGGKRTKADHPALPISPAEKARAAAECLEAGACMIHAHVRDANDRHLLDAEAYRGMIAAIRGAVGDKVVLQITSEALGIYKPEEQMRVVREVKPESVSIALREFVSDEASEGPFADFLTWMRREHVMPQVVLYTDEECRKLDDMKRRGLVPFDNIPVIYVLGRYRPGQTSLPVDLLPFLAPDVPKYERWMVCAFGVHEEACVTTAAMLGGHVRVGFENNIWMPDGSLAPSNAALVTRMVEVIGACGGTLMKADELREFWEIH